MQGRPPPGRWPRKPAQVSAQAWGSRQFQITWHLTCKRGSVGQSEGLSIPRSSVRFRLKPNTSNSHEFELHTPSNKGTKLLLKVIKAIIIIRGRGTEASTTRQVPLTTGTITPRPVPSQTVQPAYVGEAVVSGNARCKVQEQDNFGNHLSLNGTSEWLGTTFLLQFRSNTADFGLLNQASGSNVPVDLLPRPRVNENIFPGLSSGSDGDYCTWLIKNKLALLLGAPSYRLFDAGSFQGTFVNPTLHRFWCAMEAQRANL